MDKTKRLVIEVTVPADWDKVDAAIFVDSTFGDYSLGEVCSADPDATVWDSRADYLADVEEGLA